MFRPNSECNRSFVGREEGMFTFVNIVAVMFCALMVAFVLNVGHITHQKIEMQNAADSVAYSATLWQARGMNAITATNHVMGEMMAFVIVHHAIGGERLDHPQMGPANTLTVDSSLDRAAAAAQSLGASTPAYTTVRQRSTGVVADKTILSAKKQLKEILTNVYYAKVGAKIMQMYPPTRPAGRALELALNAFEPFIKLEYQLLKQLHRIAYGLRGYKFILRDEMLPEARDYTDEIVRLIPLIARDVAENLGQKHGVLATLYPKVPSLPVVKDPFRNATLPIFSSQDRVSSPQQNCGCPSEPATNMREQIVKTTQLARATWPWVNYHRQPIIDALKAAVPLSGAGDFYFEHTAGTSKELLNQFQLTTDRDLGLYVMKGYAAPDKGYELWTEDPVKADNLFTTVALVFRDPPKVIGEPAVFHQAHSRGRVAITQAMLYNGHEQERPKQLIDLNCKRIVPVRQANVGWDTLNWLEGGNQEKESCSQTDGEAPSRARPENRPYELVGFGIPHEFPQIQLGWQAKLVPLTSNRVGQAVKTAPDPYKPVLEGSCSDLQIFRTH